MALDTFEGRGAVVTGGASGIGFATARELAHRGAAVVLADVDEEALAGAVDGLRGEGLEAHGVPCDVRHLEAVEELAARSFDLLGRVHVVFNNAGVAIAGPIAEVTHDDWRWVLDIDLWGPIHGVEAFLPRLRDQGEGGHVLFTSSFAGLVPNVGLGPYCVAKYGVVALAEVLARELKPEGIGVSVVCPMIVRTGIGTNSARRRILDGGADDVEEALAGIASPSGVMDAGLDAGELARLIADAVLADRLYVLPHSEARDSIRRRFERIDRTFDEQAAAGWSH